MTPSRRRQWAVALMFVTPAFWSVNYLVARSASHTIAPHMLAFGRWLLAGALMAAMHWREIARQPVAVRAEGGRFLVLGALGMWICGAFVYIAGRTTTATNIGLIYAISPVLVALFSTFVLTERIALAQIAGTLVAIAGFLHIVLKGAWGGFAAVELTPGDWWIFVAAISWAAYTILLKAWPSVFGPGARLALISLGGAIVILPFAIGEAIWFMASEVSWQNAGYVATTAIIPGVGAYLAYSFMLRELGASRVAVVLYLGPIYGALMGWLVLGESIRSFHWAGAALILPGIFLATRRGKA
jgi:drug/metabolite transporter (DMT)-like permease